MNDNYKSSPSIAGYRPILHVSRIIIFFMMLLFLVAINTTLSASPRTKGGKESTNNPRNKRRGTNSNSEYSTEYIKDIKTKLKQLGYTFYEINGELDFDTKYSIETFQRNHDLTVDGDPGPKTKDLIYEELKKRHQESPSPQLPPVSFEKVVIKPRLLNFPNSSGGWENQITIHNNNSTDIKLRINIEPREGEDAFLFMINGEDSQIWKIFKHEAIDTIDIQGNKSNNMKIKMKTEGDIYSPFFNLIFSAQDNKELERIFIGVKPQEKAQTLWSIPVILFFLLIAVISSVLAIFGYRRFFEKNRRTDKDKFITVNPESLYFDGDNNFCQNLQITNKDTQKKKLCFKFRGNQENFNKYFQIKINKNGSQDVSLPGGISKNIKIFLIGIPSSPSNTGNTGDTGDTRDISDFRDYISLYSENEEQLELPFTIGEIFTHNYYDRIKVFPSEPIFFRESIETLEITIHNNNNIETNLVLAISPEENQRYFKLSVPNGNQTESYTISISIEKNGSKKIKIKKESGVESQTMTDKNFFLTIKDTGDNTSDHLKKIPLILYSDIKNSDKGELIPSRSKGASLPTTQELPKGIEGIFRPLLTENKENLETILKDHREPFIQEMHSISSSINNFLEFQGRVEGEIKSLEGKVSKTEQIINTANKGIEEFKKEVSNDLAYKNKQIAFLAKPECIRVFRDYCQRKFAEALAKEYNNDPSSIIIFRFKNLIKELSKISDDINDSILPLYKEKEVYNSLPQDIYKSLGSILKEITRYPGCLKKGYKYLGFLVSETRTSGDEKEEEVNIFKKHIENYIDDYININKGKDFTRIKELFDESDLPKRDYKNIKDDLIFGEFSSYFSIMAEIDQKGKTVSPKLKERLKYLGKNISDIIEKYFELKPMSITLGKQYNSLEHEASTSENASEDYESKAIISVRRWGYKSTKDDRVSYKAAVLIKR